LEISALDMIFKQIRRIFANRPRSTDMKNYILLILLFFTAFTVNAQSFKVYGKVTNNKLEPLAFANIQLKEQQSGIMTKEDGSYEMNLEVGQYTMVISIIGYKTQVVNLLVNKDYEQNIILDEDTVTSTMEDVVIKFRVKDRSEEIMRNVHIQPNFISKPFNRILPPANETAERSIQWHFTTPMRICKEWQ
jgi:hypothetical protein